MASRTIEVLNRLSDALGGASDYEVAQNLDVTRATVSKWRNGVGSMSDETALRAASFIDQVSPEALLLEMAAERSTDQRAKEMYRRVAKIVRKTAAVFVIGFTGILGLFQAQPVKATPLENAVTVYYGKRRMRIGRKSLKAPRCLPNTLGWI